MKVHRRRHSHQRKRPRSCLGYDADAKHDRRYCRQPQDGNLDEFGAPAFANFAYVGPFHMGVD